MKQLSIEQKARAYEQAIKRAKAMIPVAANQEEIYNSVITIFPELAESESERIRKELIKQVVYIVPNDDETDNEGNVLPTYQQRIDRYIAWLEAQGEHANFCNKIQIGDKVTRNQDGVLVNLSQLKRVAKPTEKQGEQKSVVKTQMVYPKFRIGDVISPNVEDGKGDYTIVGFNETLADYLVDGGNIPSCSIGIEFIDANFHIKEHKHVEHTRNEILSELVAEKWHYLINDCKLGSVVNVKLPFNWFDWLCRWFYASGEQSVEQKPAWSEEDEKMIDAIYSCVDSHYDGLAKTSLLIWLKSLKPNHWKPSDEQMRELGIVATGKGWFSKEILSELLEQLKKLRGE